MKITKKESIIRVLIIVVIIAVIILISVFTEKKNSEITQQEFDTVYLFNGENLDNWDFILKDSTANPENTFSIKEGNLWASGDPFGYIKTKESYSDYQLFVDWRWVEDPGNSGVLIHIIEDGIWPLCLECQLMSGKAGDLVCFTGFEFKEHVGKDSKVVAKQDDISEKLAGEWNTYDIRVIGDSVSIYVNDVFQNTASETNFSSGNIALQSEGVPIEFRNIFLLKEKE